MGISGGRTWALFLPPHSQLSPSDFSLPATSLLHQPRYHTGPAQDLGGGWGWACLSVSLMLAFSSGTSCTIVPMSSPAWRRAARTSSRSISCTLRLRAISYKCHCRVMDVWQGVWGYRRPGGPVTPGAPRPMLNFHFQEPLPTLSQCPETILRKCKAQFKSQMSTRSSSRPGRNVWGSAFLCAWPSCRQSPPWPQPVVGAHTANAFLQRTAGVCTGQSPGLTAVPTDCRSF